MYDGRHLIMVKLALKLHEEQIWCFRRVRLIQLNDLLLLV